MTTMTVPVPIFSSDAEVQSTTAKIELIDTLENRDAQDQDPILGRDLLS